jgi:predicted nuclease of restriction endonuclease-like (RecB) superfamily
VLLQASNTALKSQRIYMKKSIVKKSKSPAAKEYAQLLEQIKQDILRTQIKAAMSVTKELTLLYYSIGKLILEKIITQGWGAKVIDNLAQDLENSFPGMQGFSIRNLKYMKKFAESYTDSISAAAVALIPWGHNLVLLDKLSDNKQRFWYAEKTVENGWSRAVLTMWIESDLFKRQGKAITNFQLTLPKPDSDLAQQILKDPYNFDFLTIDSQAREKEIELGLMSHIQKFLIELGQGFAFIGQQYHLQIGDQDFYIDLLFYHIELRCFVVIELKADKLDMRDIGQINLYLAAVDDSLKRPEDKPTIGLLLCKSKNNYVAEYALRYIKKPVGVAHFTTKLVETLPKEFKGKLPTIKEIEVELKKAKPIKAKKLVPEKTIIKKSFKSGR